MKRLKLVLIAAIAAIIPMMSSTVHAATNEHLVYTGYVSNTAVLTGNWHPIVTGGLNQAIDIGKSGNPAGYSVRMLSENVSGGAMNAYRFGLGGTDCTGYEIRIRPTTTTTFMGEVRYVHIDPSGGTPFSWSMAANGGFTAVHLGTVSADQEAPPDGDCPWTDRHLHQGEELSGPAKHSSMPYSLPYGGSNTWMFSYAW